MHIKQHIRRQNWQLCHEKSTSGNTALMDVLYTKDPQTAELFLRALLETPTLELNCANMFDLSQIFCSVNNSRILEVRFIRDTASPMLQTIKKGIIEVLKIEWFRNVRAKSRKGEMARELVYPPSLKCLARKAIEDTMSKQIRIPASTTVITLKLPNTLIRYTSFHGNSMFILLLLLQAAMGSKKWLTDQETLLHPLFTATEAVASLRMETNTGVPKILTSYTNRALMTNGYTS